MNALARGLVADKDAAQKLQKVDYVLVVQAGGATTTIVPAVHSSDVAPPPAPRGETRRAATARSGR